MPDFKKDLLRGDKGEAVIEKRYLCKKSKDLRYDLISAKGKTWEVKTDYYDMKKTPNFFIEKISNEEKNTLGGPWRAHKDGVEIFSYLYFKNRKHYIWEVDTLVEQLEKLVEGKEMTSVKNEYNGQLYYTLGYKIPRKLLEWSCFRVDVIDERFYK